ncbi:hypothetical protein BKA66DRAFT_600120 [Pyrenochaeta sp. MPI-SDFR-AT-0127]|nr:hypothetical protein BKA66DRAFT_600120 [Pyrenochaeta sp. MPI-SDFR-AT-0127]
MGINSPYNAISTDSVHLSTVQIEEYRLQPLKKDASFTHLVLDKPSEYDQAGGHRLRRFYFRALVGVLGPALVCGYFIAVWRIYLAPIDPDSPVTYGLPGATWIFYSWFVAGVIGLNLSLYGMAGVEAAMLMESAWNVGDAMRLMMHADKTWSGPGGWMKTIKWVVQLRRGSGHGKLPSRLWFVLALPSMLVFTAWPLSGLTMEVTQGYLHGKRYGSGVMVTGFSYDNFNERKIEDARNGAFVTWKNALDAHIPGQGIVYTPEGVDRSQHDLFKKVPNAFPKDDGVTRVFLTSQAEHPIEGNNWGLLLQYNCSIVDKVEDLTVLRNRNSTAHAKSILNASGQVSYRIKDDSIQVILRNQTDTGMGNWVENLHAVMEMGYQLWPNKTALEQIATDDPNSMFTKTTGCYFNEAANATGDYPGIDQEQLFEILLWQNLQNISRGPYPVAPMTAIGVQCKASSSVGTADLNGVRSTYSNFKRTDTPIEVQTLRCANRFAADVPVSMLPRDSGKEWLSYFFTSSAAPPPFYASYVSDDSDFDTAVGYNVQLNYLQAEQLRSSLLRSYSAYAVQLMYNGGQGFTAVDGSHITFLNPNITEFVPGTVLKLGVMPAVVPVALFCLWALVGSVLGILYGFRRRWSEILDGYTMFRLGADLPLDVKKSLDGFSNTLEVEECSALNDMPGLVGDTMPEMWMGHVGLVGQSVADKAKMYE